MNTFKIQIVFNHDNTVIREMTKACSCTEAAMYANDLCRKFVNCSWRIMEIVEAN